MLGIKGVEFKGFLCFTIVSLTVASFVCRPAFYEFILNAHQKQIFVLLFLLLQRWVALPSAVAILHSRPSRIYVYAPLLLLLLLLAAIIFAVDVRPAP